MQQHSINIEQHFNQISNIPDRNQNRGLRWSLKIFLFFLKWKYLVYRKTQVRYQDKYIKIHNLNNPFLPVHSSLFRLIILCIL